MPISSSISIRGSVGWKAKNDLADVRIIQTRLNELMKSPRVKLVVDGRSGPKTEAMILDFQKVVMNNPRGDAKVDPGGATLRALNDAASEGKWSLSSPAPVAPVLGGGSGGSSSVSYPPMASPMEKLTIDLLTKSAQASGDKLPMEVLNLMLQADSYNHFKNLMNAIGAAQWASDFGVAVKGMRNFGMDAKYILWVFKEFAKYKDGKGLSDLLALMKARPELGGAVSKLNKLGSLMNVAAVLFCVVEVVNHMQAGRLGAALAEIYGSFMQIAVPWAGFVDAIQSVTYAYAPGLEGKPGINYFFRLVNAINPIGAGKTAVDAAGTLIETAVVSYQKGSFDQSRLEMLVKRMKSTPMSVFVGWGEALGDYMGDKYGDFYYEHFLK